MSLISYKRGQGSIILRVKILDSSVSTGAGKTALAFGDAGLIISTIADNEATATIYAQASSNTETITTLGTFAAPTAGKARFKKVDDTNHPGVCEIQIADARYAITDAKSLLVSISGVTDLAETDVVIPLRDVDPYSVAMGRAVDGIVIGAATGVPTTTVMSTTGLDPAAVDTNQWGGKVLTFAKNTTTTGLRGQTAIITSMTNAGIITFESAVTTAPVSGDIFTIQ